MFKLPDYPCRWTMPDSYFGETWPDYFRSGFGQHRDSDALTRSNFIVALKELGGETETVFIVRESHWAVGWIEWIAIHADDAKALETATRLNAKVADHPALSEDHWSELEWNEARDYWERMSVKERVDMIRSSRCSASIFAARRPSLPEDADGSLFDYLRAA